MGDAEFVDSFPAKPLSYYKRSHRWVRGDWQNAPWLFAAGRASGYRPLAAVRFARRSLVPPMTVLAIALGFFLPGAGARGGGLGGAARAAEPADYIADRVESERAKHRHARILSGVGGALVECFIRLWSAAPYRRGSAHRRYARRSGGCS